MASQHMLKVAGIWKLVVGFGAHNTRRIPDTRYPIPGTRDGILPFIPFAAVALPRMVAQQLLIFIPLHWLLPFLLLLRPCPLHSSCSSRTEWRSWRALHRSVNRCGSGCGQWQRQRQLLPFWHLQVCTAAALACCCPRVSLLRRSLRFQHEVLAGAARERVKDHVGSPQTPISTPMHMHTQTFPCAA